MTCMLCMYCVYTHRCMSLPHSIHTRILYTQGVHLYLNVCSQNAYIHTYVCMCVHVSIRSLEHVGAFIVYTCRCTSLPHSYSLIHTHVYTEWVCSCMQMFVLNIYVYVRAHAPHKITRPNIVYACMSLLLNNFLRANHSPSRRESCPPAPGWTGRQ